MAEFEIENGILINYNGTFGKVTIPEGTIGIAEEAFKGNSSIESVTIPSSVSFIEPYAFSDCPNLMDVKFESFPEICSDAFYNCPILVNDSGLIIADDICVGAISGTKIVKIPEGVRYISLEAFAYNTEVTEVYISKTVEVISDKAFFGCSGIKMVTVEEGAAPMFMEKVFGECKYILNEDFEMDGETLVKINSNDPVLIIPEGVVYIPTKFFCKDNRFAEVYFPGTLKKVERSLFYNNNRAEKIVISDKTEDIEPCAFMAAFYLNEIHLPSNLKAIPKMCFWSCSVLKQIEIPESVTKIEERAFSNSSVLEKINIPDGVETIEQSAFENCLSLKNITLPHNLKSLGKRVFTNSGITEIVIPANVQLDGSAFYGCSDLESVEFLGDVTELKADMFARNEKLKNVVHIENVRVIGDEAFMGCESLETIDISNAVYIGDEAFKGCKSLVSVKVPENAFHMGKCAFFGCNELYNGMAIVGTTLFSIGNNPVEVNIPDFVTTIGNKAFSHCMRLEKVVASDNLQYIGDEAFYCCFTLAEIENTESVIEVGEKAFYQCLNLNEIHFPKAEKISDYAFMNCSKIEVFDVNPNVVLGKMAIRGCNKICDGYAEWGGILYSVANVEHITLSGNIVEVGNNAFENCEYLHEVVLPEGVVSIGKNAFFRCKCLEKIYIPKSVRYIGENAFKECENLSGVLKLDNVEVIEEGAFYGCEEIEGAYLPKAKMINKEAFYLCSSLKSFEVPENVVLGEKVLSGCYLLCGNHAEYRNILYSVAPDVTEYKIPENITKIESRAFMGCNELYEVVIPSTVTCVSEAAFYACECLRRIFIEGDKTMFGDGFFARCRNVTEIHANSSITNVSVDSCTRGAYVEIYVDSFDKIREDDRTYATYACLRQLARDPSVVSAEHLAECKEKFKSDFSETSFEPREVWWHEFNPHLLLEDDELFSSLVKYKFLTVEQTDKLIDLSLESGNVERTSALLSYKHNM